MEEVKAKIANFDFENSLAKESYTSPHINKVNKTLEYLYFWLSEEEAPLLTDEIYESEFLDFVSHFVGHRVRTVEKAHEIDCWWGNLNSESDWQREKEVNSKVTSVRAANDLSLNLLGSQVISNQGDLKTFLSHYENENFCLKSPFGFSGRGLWINPEPLQRNWSFPLIGEPWKKRVRDFGSIVTEDSLLCFQNNVDSKGQYKGSLIREGIPEIEQIKPEVKNIFQWYKSHYSISSLQVDTFQYMDKGELIFNFLGEVNHRRSMGGIACELHKSFASGVSFLALISKTQLKSVGNFSDVLKKMGTLNYNPQAKVGVLPLAPPHKDLQCFAFFETSDRSLQHLIREFWEKWGKTSQRLPAEFIVYP